MVGPGTLLGGRYRLEKGLGRGGMGEVWSAFDQGLDRQVAVKILLAELTGDPALIARLRREAKAAAALQHPGITVVHDLGEHDRHPYFVMELLEGTTFSALLTAHPEGLPVARATHLMAQVADALDHAHRKGVVHRDIKPANLMELAEGGVKICDFGISRYADATTQLTATGGFLGTPAYMAPEQYEGKEADPHRPVRLRLHPARPADRRPSLLRLVHGRPDAPASDRAPAAPERAAPGRAGRTGRAGVTAAGQGPRRPSRHRRPGP